MYTYQEVIQFAKEEDVKFFRLTFCDVFGKTKNISIMPDELPRAFEYGIAFDSSAIDGLPWRHQSDLFLRPEADTLLPLPWRPEHGRVMQMLCTITYPDGAVHECDTRAMLKTAMDAAKAAGLEFTFGAEQEFYLFKTDEYLKPTLTPCDAAGYMDIAPEDRGENIRREICLTLEKMGIKPESSHHEQGPGQNEIDIRFSNPLKAADDALIFRRVAKTVADRNGMWADFSPKPLKNAPGNGFHINYSVNPLSENNFNAMTAGVLNHAREIALFANPTEQSYLRLGKFKAPKYVSWAVQNRGALIRIPAARDKYRRAELRLADPEANPYLMFALIIYAVLEGIQNNMSSESFTGMVADERLNDEDASALFGLKKLPECLDEAKKAAASSDFVNKYVPRDILNMYLGKGNC